MDETTMLNFSLSIEDANKVLTALSSRPYSEVHELISNIMSQAAVQTQPKLETPSEEE